jgi:EPS-associated MarR family transcriptional regulator
VHDEIHLKVLRLLKDSPQLNQREMADALGVSLGSINYCLRALMDKGYVKMQNFISSHNKLAYSYLLTPSGISKKTHLAAQFLKRKVTEYKMLQAEIEALKLEVDIASNIDTQKE